MGKNLIEIAQQLIDVNKKAQLIYAFNGTGKTRLSRELKELVQPKVDSSGSDLKDKKILYYSSFTEDLFYWHNDLDNDKDVKLKIHPNTFTKWVFEEQGLEETVSKNFQRYTNEKLTPRFSSDFSEVTFSYTTRNTIDDNIKISKGEESNFIWSIFYTLIEQVVEELNIEESDRSTDKFNNIKYVFIDDPVSSLDENHLIEMAVNLARLIKNSNFDMNSIKFIITTHNSIFYNILYRELGVNQGFLLEKNSNGLFLLSEKKGDSNTSFSYHLHLRSILKKAINDNAIEKYHFMLLRNLYEKTAGFLGYKEWSVLLPADGKDAYYSRIINFSSHSSLANETSIYLTDAEKNIVSYLLNDLTTRYSFYQLEQ